MQERLQKILSQWGIASRRQAEQMILAGRVRVNGTLADLGQKADAESDRIEVDGRLLKMGNRPKLIYLLLHKPAGVVSTCSDPQGRTTVLDLLPPELRLNSGIHPVGRLDADTTGALILTNDGELTFRLLHPSHKIAKKYQVWVHGQPPQKVLENWRQGVLLAGKKTLPAQVKILKTRANGDKTLLEIVIEEGRNRQIRRVAETLGYPVIHIHRVAVGPIQLQTPQEPLLSGQYRPLKDDEIDFLQRAGSDVTRQTCQITDKLPKPSRKDFTKKPVG
ncbi:MULTISPECIES: pseudouridine synthase [Aerosakkonema]|uniref:pseudouridine synthase n=1 Tax=Aerosakkonema TaxID=1246629 RepID=UPI0035B9F132